MTQFACIADCHIGNHKRFGGSTTAGINRRCRSVLDTFEEALDLAVSKQCEALFVAGDLFDHRRPEPQVIAATQSLINAARAKSGDRLRVVLVRGNHEAYSDEPGDHSLGPLAPVAEVVDEPSLIRIGDAEVACVPYRTGSALLWLPEAVGKLFGPRKPRKPKRVLILHLGISDEKTAPWLKNAHDAIPVSALEDLCEKYRIGLVLAGNWHDRRSWKLCKGKSEALQIGALVPTGFDNPGLEGYGGVAVVGLEGGLELNLEEVAGPRFVKLTPKARDALLAAQKFEGEVFVEMTAPAESLGGCTTELAGMVSAGALADAVVLPDAREIGAAARTAALAARSSETMYEALAAYVQEMPLPEGVDRDAVLARARRYLARSEG